jgi:hypothetical protein
MFDSIQPVQDTAPQHEYQRDEDDKKQDNKYFHKEKAARAG